VKGKQKIGKHEEEHETIQLSPYAKLILNPDDEEGKETASTGLGEKFTLNHVFRQNDYCPKRLISRNYNNKNLIYSLASSQNFEIDLSLSDAEWSISAEK
jgi:hypothetical protein